MRAFRISTAILIAYTLVIILWGAFVRISGSGDGCGAHWPLCHGSLIPDGDFRQALATWIEYFHRLKSGLYGILIFALCIWSFRLFPAKHLARKASLAALLFTVSEALIGAALVLFGWVGQDDSPARVFVMAAHLMNTFFLLGSLVFLFVYAEPNVFRWKAPSQSFARQCLVAIGLFFLMAITGAWAALSSTLYPADSLWSGLADDLHSDSPWLLRVRLLHPFVTAIGFVGLVVISLQWRARHGSVSRLFLAFPFILGSAFVFGWMTLLFLSPVWMKLGHLLLTDILWMSLVYLIARAGK